ncbi:EamA family transporter [Chloroflexi bacterium TSY]|nr:EamA family transporter [Chloroflexi bacterium TSY]
MDSFFRPFRFALCHSSLYQKVKFVMIGLIIYACATLFWVSALSRVDLSYAYPFVSLSFVIMLIASWHLFGETLNAMRLLGTFIICVGVFLVARS